MELERDLARLADFSLSSFRAVVENTLFVNPGTLCRQARSMVAVLETSEAAFATRLLWAPLPSCGSSLPRVHQRIPQRTAKSRLLESQVFRQ